MHSYKISLEYDRVLERIRKYIKTETGAALLAELPECRDEKEIYARFSLIGDIKNIISFDTGLYFDDIFDMREQLKRLKIEGYILEPAQLYKLAKTLRALTELRSSIFKCRAKYPVLFEFTRDLKPFEKTYSEIFRCIESDSQIKDGASDKLRSIRREISSLASKVQNKLKDMINKLKAHTSIPEDYVTIREGRFVIPIPASQNDRVKGIIHDYSQTRATAFVEPLAILNENNKLRELKEGESFEIARIIAALNDAVRPEVSDIAGSLEIAFELDMYQAIANFAIAKKCECVKVSQDGELEIINGRHPLLASEGCVPLNLKIDKKHDILLLSGPNAGGKTVLLKTIGLFCILVKMGIPVPANPSSVVPFIENMFVDIGDSQSIIENLSTFSGHVRFLSAMVAGIENPAKTMVLLDELGSGSAPNYSSAIACAIIWRLAQKKVRAVITTHFSGVVDYIYSLDNAINGSLEFDAENLRPTYRLIMGIPGASYAIHIARNYGLQPEIIEKAVEFLDQNEVKYEDLISELIKYSGQLKDERGKLVDENARLLEIENDLKEKEKRFVKTRNEILEELREEYEKKYNEIYKKVTSAVAVKDGASAVKQERVRLAREIMNEKRALNEAPPAIAEKTGEAPEAPVSGTRFPYEVGDVILMEKFNSNAIIKEIDFKKRQARVEFKNKMEMWIKFSMISGTDENIADFESTGTISYKRSDDSPMRMELDLRGKTTDDALMELERYLLRALESHLESVRIIHGKGTMALKNAVEVYLRRSRFVKNFRSGKYGEGDYGVTIADLK